MKKQISMEETKAVISEIEDTYRCVIERSNHEPEKPPDGAAGTSGPYHSMFFVNDRLIKMASGHTITIVVGDLAHQIVRIPVRSINQFNTS
jgi:hypothetical protein